MTLARKIARERERSRRARGAKAIQRIRKEQTQAAWLEALEALAVAADFDAPDDLADTAPEPINVRSLALAAGISIVLMYVLAGVLSGC